MQASFWNRVDVAVARAAPVLVEQEHRDEPIAQLVGDRVERRDVVARPGRQLDREVVAEVALSSGAASR